MKPKQSVKKQSTSRIAGLAKKRREKSHHTGFPAHTVPKWSQLATCPESPVVELFGMFIFPTVMDFSPIRLPWLVLTFSCKKPEAWISAPHGLLGSPGGHPGGPSGFPQVSLIHTFPLRGALNEIYGFQVNHTSRHHARPTPLTRHQARRDSRRETQTRHHAGRNLRCDPRTRHAGNTLLRYIRTFWRGKT